MCLLWVWCCGRDEASVLPRAGLCCQKRKMSTSRAWFMCPVLCVYFRGDEISQKWLFLSPVSEGSIQQHDLHHSTASAAQKKIPFPPSTTWKKVPALSVMPTPGEVGQQICGIIGIGRTLFCFMKKEQEFLQAWEVQQQQSGRLWLCRYTADTRIFLCFPGFCQKGLFTPSSFITGVFPPFFALSITESQNNLDWKRPLRLLSPACAQSHLVNKPRALSATSSCSSNISRDSDSTTSWTALTNPFHEEISPVEQPELSWFSLRPLPLVLNNCINGMALTNKILVLCGIGYRSFPSHIHLTMPAECILTSTNTHYRKCTIARALTLLASRAAAWSCVLAKTEQPRRRGEDRKKNIKARISWKIV